MDCREIMELLDAYALGALEKAEADAVERHVADCVRCWDELGGAQRAAALLALSIPMQQAPDALRERIMAKAERENPASVSRAWSWRRLRLTWGVTAGGFASLGVAALVFAVFLQVQMSDLRSEKNDLGQKLAQAGAQIGQQQQILAVLSAADAQKIPMGTASSNSGASAVYGWSQASRKGFILCSSLPLLQEGQEYQAWFKVGSEAVPAGKFTSVDGTCQVPVDLSWASSRPDGIGITPALTNGAVKPSGEWLLYASFGE